MKLAKSFWFPTILAAITSFFLLGTKSFWLDESYSYYISHSLRVFLSTAWNDEINMWLYHFLLHFWLIFGKSEFAIRSLSAIFAILSIPIFYKVGERLFNKKVAFIASILLSIHIFFITYAQEARSYTLYFLLGLLSVYSFLKFNEDRKYKALFIVSSTLSVYAHLYAGFIIITEFIYLFLKNRLKDHFLNFIIIGFLLIPLLLAPSLRAHTVDWIPRPTISNIFGTFFLFSGDFLPLSLIYGLLFAYSFLNSLLNKKNLFVFLWIFLPIIAAFIISEVKTIYQSVYFFALLPPFLYLISYSLDKIKNKTLLNLVFFLLLSLSLTRLYFWYTSSPIVLSIRKIRFSFINNRNEDWRNAVNYVSENGKPEDIAIFYGYYGKLDYEYYAKPYSPKIVEITSAPYILGAGTKLPEPNKSLIESFTTKNIWFVVNRETGTDFDRAKQYQQIESMLQKKYIKIHEVEYYKVKVEMFTANGFPLPTLNPNKLYLLH